MDEGTSSWGRIVHETELPVDDPSATHVLVRSTDRSGPSELTRQRRGMLTSLSVLVAGVDAGAEEQVRSVTDWAPPQFRVEFVLVAPAEGPGAGDVTRRLDDLAFAWTVVEAPAGGRGPALDRASSESTGEFVVVPGAGGDPAVDALSDALGHMWVNGADALVITSGAGHPDPEVPDSRADRLGAALGLCHGDGGPALVVLRRWVARFLFDEIGRAIDPVEEFADRVRLLELRLIEVLTDT